MADERSLLVSTPDTAKQHQPLESSFRTAPRQMRSSIELNNAHSSNVEYRDGRYLQMDAGESDSDSEDEDADTRSETVKDLGMNYDGFPDGNSILMGTPSRFLEHGNSPAAYMLFNGNQVSAPHASRMLPQRRQSSSETTVSPRKPSLSRAETSPTFLGTLSRIVTSGARPTASTAAVTSPRSALSGSSGDRTLLGSGDHDRSGTLSPIGTPHNQSRVSALPARTLSQRTQKLFRRMSSSHSEPRSPHDKSPLPTLTSTPSSAYINTVPKDVRRPSTSQARQTSPELLRGPPNQHDSRPPMGNRTMTEPATGRTAYAEQYGTTMATEMSTKNPLKRSDSHRKPVDAPLPEQVKMAASGGQARRRGSIREAVSGRRPWR